MKACIIQPPYSMDTAFSDEYFEFKMKMLDECDDSIDIIVLPEYSDVPCATSTKEETFFWHKKYINTLLDKCIETAKRCNAVVFFMCHHIIFVSLKGSIFIVFRWNRWLIYVLFVFIFRFL